MPTLVQRSPRSGRSTTSSRAAVRAATAIGLCSLGLPVITSLTAPAAAASSPCVATATVVTCTYRTAGSYVWVAPLGLTQATFEVDGAMGARGDGAGLEGDGTHVVATISITPGHSYHVTVGGNGALGGPGGFNGGGDVGDRQAGSGGGASDVRMNTGAGSRVIVAGGGGGGGGDGSWCQNDSSRFCSIISGPSGYTAGGSGGSNTAGTDGSGACGTLSTAPDGLGGGFPPAPHQIGIGGAGGPGAPAGGNGTSTDGGAGGVGGGASGGGGGGGYGGGGGGGSGQTFAETDAHGNVTEYCDGAGGGGAAGVSYVDPSLVAPGTTPVIAPHADEGAAVIITYSALLISPAIAHPGQVVAIDGSGFDAGETVTLSTGGNVLDEVIASPTGTLRAVVFAPAMPRGNQLVSATGSSSGHVLNGQLSIVADVVAHPAGQTPGAGAKAGLFGFSPATSVTLYWDTNGGTNLGHGLTDAMGSLTIPFVVPAGATTGVHRLVAVTSAGAVAAGFAVTTTFVSPPPNPTVGSPVVFPNTAAPGQTVFVTAAGLTPGDTVPITIGSSATPLAQPVALSNGVAAATIVVPSLPLGTVDVHIGTQQAVLAVHPALVLLTTSAPAGAPIPAAVAGFTSTEPVLLHWQSASGVLLGTIAPDGHGLGNVTVSVPATATVGSAHIVAVDTGGHAAVAALTIVKASTATAIASTGPTGVVLGQPVTFTATVSREAPSSGMATGHVRFTEFVEGSFTPPKVISGCQSVPVDSTGRAACTTALNTLGTIVITGAYSGDAQNSASSASLVQLVGYAIKYGYGTSTPQTARPIVITVTLTNFDGVKNLTSSKAVLTVACLQPPGGGCVSPGSASTFTNAVTFYQYSIAASRLTTTGSYVLHFTVTGDPLLHDAPFVAA